MKYSHHYFDFEGRRYRVMWFAIDGVVYSVEQQVKSSGKAFSRSHWRKVTGDRRQRVIDFLNARKKAKEEADLPQGAR